MFKFRNEIKEILEMDLEEKDKLDKIAELKTTTTEAGRVISVREDEALEWLDMEGEIVKGIGRHWTDANGDNILSEDFNNETQRDMDVVFKVENVKGYKVQYFGERALCRVFEDDEEMYNFINEMEEDEVYQGVMDLIGTDADMSNEQEIIISNNTEFIVDYVSDSRDEEGHIIVNLLVK